MKVLKDQSGFTIIELILSFVFVFTIAFSMYQLVFNYREKRDQEAIYATMTDYKNEVVLAIQRDLNDRVLKSIDYCTTNSVLIPRCLVLYFNDGTSKQLSVETEQIEYDGELIDSDYIKYGNVNYKNDEAFLVEFKANYMLYKVPEEEIKRNRTIYKIAIPIYHNDLGDEDFGIYIVAVGFNYNSATVDGDGTSGTSTLPVWSSEGRTFSADNHTKCTTRVFSHNDISSQVMIVRFRINDLDKSKGSRIMSNMNNNGSALFINSSGKLCYGAYTLSTFSSKPVVKTVCTSSTLVEGKWYNIEAGFTKTDPGYNFSIYGQREDGTNLGIVITSSQNNDYRIAGSHMNYSIGAEPGNAINLGYFDGTIQDIALYNGVAPNSNNARNLGTGSINTKIEQIYGTEKRVFHYDFTDNSVYATYCLE